jgi:RimJ/RimL family protein N-acetyltransferase
MGEVETDRLLLRRWQDHDLERLVALHGDPRVSRFLSVDGRPWPVSAPSGCSSTSCASGGSTASVRGR